MSFLNTTTEENTLEKLLVSIDVSERDSQLALKGTLAELRNRALLDDVSSEEYLALAILVSFKRRNHSKSQAPGEGAGEKAQFLTVLRDIAESHPEIVHRVLPLVPLYGSWRDLQLLADVLPSELVQRVAEVFAQQLQRDLETLDKIKTQAPKEEPAEDALSEDGKVMEEDKATTANKKRKYNDEDVDGVSNAAKYAPREHRHRGSKKTRKKTSSTSGGRGGRGRGRGGSRGRRRDCSRVTTSDCDRNPITGKPLDKECLTEDATSDGRRERLHASQTHCADQIAQYLGLEQSMLRAQYRQNVLVPLNAHLTARGFLVEPLLCKGRPQDINFYRAAKGALSRYENAIMKNSVAKRRWMKAMGKSSAAVVDIDNLNEAASQFLDEQELMDEGLREDEATFRLRVTKAIETALISRKRLTDQAREIIEQVKMGSAAEAPEIDAVQEALTSAVLPVVDLSDVSKKTGIALILTAFVTLRAQATDGVPQLMAIHGDQGHHIVHVDPDWNLANLVDHIQELGEGVFPGNLTADSLATIVQTLLPAYARAVAEQGEAADADAEAPSTQLRSMTGPLDLLVLCKKFVAGVKSDEPQLKALVERLPSLCPSQRARGFLVHQITACDIDSGIVLQPRRAKDFDDISDATVDIAFVMDLTSSMSSMMDAAKTHLTSLIRDLKEDTMVGNIRVAFVGYRDFRDNGRVVKKNFVSMDKVEKVVEFIVNQRASGGADFPEDVLSGMEAAIKLDWQGHIRLIIQVADAPAHGYSDYPEYDDFPSGLCPDQTRSLPEAMQELKDEKKVDLLCCPVAEGFNKMETMFQNIYSDEGFGVIPLSHGSSKFHDVILSTLSKSILSVIVDPDMSGVQTFRGTTMSSAISTCNASLRESFQAIARELGDEDETEEEVTEKVSEEVTEKATEEITEKIEEAEEVEVAEVAGDMEDEATEEAMKETKAMDISLATRKPRNPRPTKSRSDKSRLMLALESEDLIPVRLALGLPIPGGKSLSVDAAKLLLRAGVTVLDLVKNGYPQDVIVSMKQAAGTVIRRI